MQLAPTKGKGMLVGVWATTKYLFDPEGPAEQATWLYELKLAVERARKRRVAALMSATPGMSESKALEAPVTATPPPPMEYCLLRKIRKITVLATISKWVLPYGAAVFCTCLHVLRRM